MSSSGLPPNPDELLGRYLVDHDVSPAPLTDDATSLAALHTRQQAIEGRWTATRPSVRDSRMKTLFGAKGRFVVGAVAAALVVALGAQLRRSTAAAPPETYSTGIGQRQSVTLADGSHVILAPQTTLTVRGHDAELRGEALFTIAHQPQNPLVIRTGSVSTRILGTTFSLKYYPGDVATRVIVLEGRVSTGGAKPVVVSAGMLARVTDSSTVFVADGNPETRTAWTNGRLVFEGTTVADMLSTLERWYGFQFRGVDSAFAAQRIEADFTGRSKPDVLKALKSLLDVSMTFDGSVVVLRRNTTSQTSPRTGNSRSPIAQFPTEVGR